MSNNPSIIPNSLRNKSKGFPYIGGSIDVYDELKEKDQQTINAEVDGSIELLQSEINALDSQNYVTVTADDQTTAVTDVLPPEGEKNTVYRVGNWDGTQYNPTVYSEYGWDAVNEIYKPLDVKEYTLATAQDFIEPDATKKAKVPTVGAVSEVYGYYEENPEFVKVLLDSNGRIIEAVRKDGTKMYGAGIVVNGNASMKGSVSIGGNIEMKYASIMNIDNSEYIHVVLDSEGHIMESTDYKGKKTVGGDLSILGTLLIPGAEYTLCQSAEWIRVLLDKDERIIAGIDRFGKLHGQFEGVEREVQEYIATEFLNKPTLDKFSENDGRLLWNGEPIASEASLSSVVTDLPVSDGTGIESGYAYIDIADRTIKVKV